MVNVGSTAFVGGVIIIAGVSLFAYLMWHVSPDHSIEKVMVVAVTEAGCIAETIDGYPVNVGNCQVQPGEFIDAPVDQKMKERQYAMNPST